MGDFNLQLDAGSALYYLEEKAKGFFGKDSTSLEAAAWLSGLQNTALTQTRSVQCVGMHKPVPFDDIYQPTSLVIKGAPQKKQEVYAYEDRISRSIVASRHASYRAVNVENFLASPDDAVIFAGPGWGKSTFLHYIFRRFLDSPNVFPVLITLRRPTAIDDLKRFVETVEKIAKRRKGHQILLLVDGYDEINLAQQRVVSEALLCFQGYKVGKFYLTCREYYDVLNLNVSEVRISGFGVEEKYKFVAAFLKAFESELDSRTVVDELEERGFGDFLTHPLLLALACIVKTSANTVQPRSALRLLERAIEVLCERWDAHKGLVRETTTPLDGRDRVQVLKRIAYVAASPFLHRMRAEVEAQKQIDLLNLSKVDARQALMETAKFYGILVPTEDGWEFVHRTVHDFLAASYWVETGGFAAVKKHTWSARTAYAACLTQDATEIFRAALQAPDGLPVVAEMLSNAAPMDAKAVAESLRTYFSKSGHIPARTAPERITYDVAPASDFIRGASTRLLDRLVEEYSKKRTAITDPIVACCLLELRDRGVKLDYVTYNALKTGFQSENLTLHILGAISVEFAEMNPAKGKVIPLLGSGKKIMSGHRKPS
jgi:hypothetical protein